MSHEVSETIKRNGKWINVYGRDLPKAGQQLPGSQTYDTLEDAELSAQERSDYHAKYGNDPQIQLKKYRGTDPKLEAQHIINNRLRSNLQKLKKLSAIKSGEADSGINTMPLASLDELPPTRGKYFGRRISKDDSMLEQFPDILDRHLHMMRQQTGVNLEEDLANMLQSGAFKDASDRHSIWSKRAEANGYQVAGGPTFSPEQQRAIDANKQRQPVPGIPSKPAGETIVVPQGKSGLDLLMEEQRKADAAKKKRLEEMTK